MASDLHQQLVRFLLAEADRRYGVSASLYADLGPESGMPPPPQIAASRPDVLANCPRTPKLIVGEAKSRKDITPPHTRQQLNAYLEYLARNSGGELWMAVPWAGLDEAYYITRSCKRETGSRVPFVVFALAPDCSTCVRIIEERS